MTRGKGIVIIVPLDSHFCVVVVSIFCTQIYDIKYSYLIQITCKQLYGFKYCSLILIII